MVYYVNIRIFYVNQTLFLFKEKFKTGYWGSLTCQPHWRCNN